MTLPIFGPGSNLTPNYTKEAEQEHAKKTSSSSQSGAILSKDSLEVPFEKQVSIQSQEAGAGRPFLPPLFRMRFAEDAQIEDLTLEYYKTLREGLSSHLKAKLEKEEKVPANEKDPNLAALDASLKFEANLLALADRAAMPSSEKEQVLHGAQQHMALPALVQQEILTYGGSIVHFLDDYLASVGRSDASYEPLVNVLNQIKEALELLNDEEKP